MWTDRCGANLNKVVTVLCEFVGLDHHGLNYLRTATYDQPALDGSDCILCRLSNGSRIPHNSRHRRKYFYSWNEHGDGVRYYLWI